MSSETAVETKYCSNCKKDIAVANFTMHEVHCRRHLVLCEKCQEPVPRTELDQHLTDIHAMVPCSQCAVEIEKADLDDHLENNCCKRQVSCEYCELQVPHCDLAAHVEFCGTRTEACPRCSNFVMHKDLLRHNSSNCTYPEVKPPAVHPTGVIDSGRGDDRFAAHQRAGFFGFRELDDSFNPFEFEEIRRALEGDSEGRVMQNSVVEDSDASAASGEMRAGRNGGGRRGSESRRKVNVKRNDTRAQDTTTTNQKSDVNRQRDQACSQTIPPDIDYDTMLAMQLSAADDDEDLQGLDLDAHLNQLMNNFEKRSQQQGQRQSPMEQDDVVVPASPPPSNDDFAAADEDMIPCEFCKETFPAYALVHHQSVCDPLATGLWGGEVDMSSAFSQNNARTANSQWTAAVSRPAIPVINNLGSASSADEEASHHLSDNGDHFLNSLETTMLPCEFCNDLWPAESLVQHQALCEGKPSTPQVRTPAAALPSSASSGRLQRNIFFPTSTNSSGMGQPDPTEELLATISRSGQENVGGNIRPRKELNSQRGSNPRMATGSRDVLSTSRTSGARPQQHRTASGEQHDFPLHSHSRGSRPNQSHTDSSNRTRHTLNSLLSGETEDDQESGVGGPRPGSSRRSQGSRKRTSNPGAPSPSTGVSSRTVMRNLQLDRRQRHQLRSENREGETNTTGAGDSQRERGDHVFNFLSSTRNPPSQNRPRRPSNRQMRD